ncbi:casein kinase I-like isoform X1 [Vespula maculifrons]|uniref:Casein kinase I-like isoform X1 n=1 Tax=Vespula maculifrons TaxID=7453 RepID=A0ABD2B5K0_VESMC
MVFHALCFTDALFQHRVQVAKNEGSACGCTVEMQLQLQEKCSPNPSELLCHFLVNYDEDGGALMSLFCVSFVLEAPMRRQWPHPPWWPGGQAFHTTSEPATAIAES